MIADWALVGANVATPDGLRPAAVLVRGEKVAAVVAPDEVPAGCPVEDVGERWVLPGLVDLHVHVNEPGRTDWEGFETATRAAAAGGITTLVDMPLNSSPVTTTVEALRQKRAVAAGKLWVDCGLHGGIVPGNADQVEPLAAAGVCGFKAFLCPSGIDEFPHVTEADLRLAMPRIAAAGLPLLVHAELPGPLSPGVERRFADNPRSYAAYLASRPPEWEHAAIRLMIRLCREYRCRVHIVHLSSSEGRDLIASAKAEGLPITVETCPHYLSFVAEQIPDGDPRFKCAPPIRDSLHRAGLIDGLLRGRIDTIGSDHSPAPPGMKELETGDLRRAWGGIASLQLMLPAVWTQLGGCDKLRLIDALCRRPAKLAGLHGRKGGIAPGFDADLVVFDPDVEWTVRPEQLHHRHKITPYAGRTLRGRVAQTYLRGRKIYADGAFCAERPSGQLLARTRRGDDGIAVNLERINSWSDAKACEEFLRCCGSRRWAEQMAARRPFACDEEIFAAAHQIWWDLARADWLEAFAAHPRIGQLDAAKQSSWSAGEQAGVAGAAAGVLRRLAEGNRQYEAKFGHIYLVCASGKSGEEMAALLEERLRNDPEMELRVAAGEQARITLLRLQKL